MIPAKTRCETHIGELLAIVEAFKTGRYYLEGCKHEVSIFTNHNNLQHFMDTKTLSSWQVWWAQKLSRYHFQIDYRQGKANGAANALFQYTQWNAEEKKILQAENTKILHQLQSLLAKVSGLGVLGMSIPYPLHQVLICKIAVLSQLHQFWDIIQSKLVDKGPYILSIGGMRMRLSELQDDDKNAKKLSSEGLPEGWENIEQVLYYQGLPYIPKVICSKLISRHHNDPLAGHFDIKKTRELIATTYY